MFKALLAKAVEDLRSGTRRLLESYRSDQEFIRRAPLRDMTNAEREDAQVRLQRQARKQAEALRDSAATAWRQAESDLTLLAEGIQYAHEKAEASWNYHRLAVLIQEYRSELSRPLPIHVTRASHMAALRDGAADVGDRHRLRSLRIALGPHLDRLMMEDGGAGTARRLAVQLGHDQEAEVPAEIVEARQEGHRLLHHQQMLAGQGKASERELIELGLIDQVGIGQPSQWSQAVLGRTAADSGGGVHMPASAGSYGPAGGNSNG